MAAGTYAHYIGGNTFNTGTVVCRQCSPLQNQSYSLSIICYLAYPSPCPTDFIAVTEL
jgi:hypothetical protein